MDALNPVVLSLYRAAYEIPLAEFQIIAKGYTHKEIARFLQLSPATIRNPIQTIHQRLSVATNAELIAIMMRADY